MSKVERLIVFIEEVIPALLLAVMVLAITYGVVSRYGFDRPLTWANELAVALFVWQLFLGAAGAARRRMHIGVEVLVSLLPGRARAAQELLVNCVVLVVLGWFMYLGWIFSLDPTKQLRMIGLDYAWIYRAVPAGFALLAAHVAVHIGRAARGLVTGDYTPPRASLEALTEFEEEATGPVGEESGVKGS